MHIDLKLMSGLVLAGSLCLIGCWDVNSTAEAQAKAEVKPTSDATSMAMGPMGPPTFSCGFGSENTSSANSQSGNQAVSARTSSSCLSTPTPPFGRPCWYPHDPSLSYNGQTVYWTLYPNWLNDQFSSIHTTGNTYQPGLANGYVEGEIRRAIETWASVVNVKFVYIQTPLNSPRPAYPYSGIDPFNQIKFDFSPLDNERYGTFSANRPPPMLGHSQGNRISFNSNFISTWRNANGYLSGIYAVALHELGHFLGLGHPMDDTWDYRYDNDSKPRACRGRCRYPLAISPTIQHPIMATYFGNAGHPANRDLHYKTLDEYDIEYARAIHGTAPLRPLIEMTMPGHYSHFYTTSWEEASSVLNAFSSGSTSSARVTGFLGALSPYGDWHIHRYSQISRFSHLYITSSYANVPTPPDFLYEGSIGRAFSYWNGKFNTRMYQHHSTLNGGDYIYTTSKTPPSRYVYNADAGYIMPRASITAP